MPKCFPNYNTWRISLQMQVSFVSSGLMISTVLAVITYFLLDWLRSSMLDATTDLLRDDANDHMYYAAKDFSVLLALNTQQLAIFLVSLAELITVTHGLYNGGVSPFNGSTPVMDDAIPYSQLVYDAAHAADVTFDTGVFYSPFSTISDAGNTIMEQAASLDSLTPNLYYNPILNIYTGYEIDQLYHIYPGTVVDSSFTPIVCEWYYMAADNPNSISVTEPYLNTDSNVWMVSISKAILYPNGTLFAVAGIDISIDIIDEAIDSIALMSGGFTVYLSQSGIVINQPAYWTRTSSIMRIYESTDIDISYAQWLEINNTSISESTLMTFYDSNNTAYYFTRSFVYPFSGQNYTSIIMVCVTESSVLDQKNQLSTNYSNTFNGLFYFVLASTIVTFLTISLLTYCISKKLKIQLEGLERVLHRIVANASKTNLIDGIGQHKIDKYRKDIEVLADSCIKRLEMIEERELEFRTVEWGASRPTEVMQFEQWRKCLHPTNVNQHKDTPWKPLLAELKVKESQERRIS